MIQQTEISRYAPHHDVRCSLLFTNITQVLGLALPSDIRITVAAQYYFMWDLQQAKWHCRRYASLIHYRPQVPIFISPRLRRGAGLSSRYVTTVSVHSSILRRHQARLRSGYSERVGIFSGAQHPKSSRRIVEVSRLLTIAHTIPGKTPLNE